MCWYLNGFDLARYSAKYCLVGGQHTARLAAGIVVASLMPRARRRTEKNNRAAVQPSWLDRQRLPREQALKYNRASSCVPCPFLPSCRGTWRRRRGGRGGRGTCPVECKGGTLVQSTTLTWGGARASLLTTAFFAHAMTSPECCRCKATFSLENFVSQSMTRIPPGRQPGLWAPGR